MDIRSKLKIDATQPLWLIAMPEDCRNIFKNVQERKKGVPAEQAIFFAKSKKDLDKQFTVILKKLAEDAVFWIAYPKQTGSIASDLIRNDGWAILKEYEHRVVSSASINDDWSAVRIRKIDPKANYKSSVPMEERKTKGIDYVKRTVQLPEDAIAMMSEFDGLVSFFNSMSFSHKREYVEAIEEAKKEETRKRRIDKKILMLLKMQEHKKNKKA